MECLSVRPRLTEYALSSLGREERVAIERHLRWCAGCRKEAVELAEGAAWAGLSLAPVDPPGSLQERVVDAVSRAAGRRGPRRRRLSAATVATVAAAAVAVGALGWGALMAGRAQEAEAEKIEAEERAELAERQAREFAARLEQILLEFRLPEEQIRRVQLAPPTSETRGGGAVVLLDSENQHWAVAIVGGLSQRELPLRVSLLLRTGEELAVGPIRQLDAGGGGEVYANFDRALSNVSRVVVRGSTGRILLIGSVTRTV